MPTKHIVLQRATLDEGNRGKSASFSALLSKGKKQPDVILKEEEELTQFAVDQRSKAMQALGGEL